MFLALGLKELILCELRMSLILVNHDASSPRASSHVYLTCCHIERLGSRTSRDYNVYNERWRYRIGLESLSLRNLELFDKVFLKE